MVLRQVGWSILTIMLPSCLSCNPVQKKCRNGHEILFVAVGFRGFAHWDVFEFLPYFTIM
jgi:hypothetical protein